MDDFPLKDAAAAVYERLMLTQITLCGLGCQQGSLRQAEIDDHRQHYRQRPGAALTPLSCCVTSLRLCASASHGGPGLSVPARHLAAGLRPPELEIEKKEICAAAPVCADPVDL